MRWRSIAVFLLVSLLWGSEWIVTRDLDAPPLGALALRYGIASVVLGLVVVVRRTPLSALRKWPIAAITGVMFLVGPAILISRASGRISPGLLVVILSMTPLLAALLEGRASGGVLFPLLGGVGGTALLAAQGLSFAFGQWMGAVAALAAAALIAASIVYLRRELSDFPVMLLAAIQLASGAALLGLWSVFVEDHSSPLWSWELIRAEALLAIIVSAPALPLYYWLLKGLESFQLTASQWAVTVVGIGEGLLLVREPPGWRLLAGGAIVLASVAALMSRREEELPVTIR